MRKLCIIALVLMLAVGGVFFSNRLLGSVQISMIDDEAVNALVLGMDEVGVNSDVILLIGYQPKRQQITVMQLPRDTYFEVDGKAQRLNHVYASYLQTEPTPEVALEKTAYVISQALNVPIAVTVSFGLDAFADMVDAVGGVPINIPFDMQYRDDEQNLVIALPQGETVLSGDTAKQFVRFRSSYLQGDIGRLDAQKLFMASLLDQVTGNNIDPSKLFALYTKHKDTVHTTANAKSAIKLAVDITKNLNNCKVAFLSIPGEAMQHPSLGWRYAINKAATCDVLNTYFAADHIHSSAFDQSGAFCAEEWDAFENVYYAGEYEYTVYTPNDISNIKIVKKE